MRFYETMSRSVRDFAPIEAGSVGMYTCGPTVYRHAHIGNLRTYITADLFRRALAFEGFEVTQIVNITDVGHMTDEIGDAGEDRMDLAIEDEGLSPGEISNKYTRAFLEDGAILNIKAASRYPLATEHIPQMLELIQKLIDAGHAYIAAGAVYYDVDSFPTYGKLSHNTRAKLEAGHRLGTTDTNKRRHYDFLLWRPSQGKRILNWESPWGEGFPGWHIECSAMSMQYLGEEFDIHTGGSDHIFPHHEDEIAQSEGATGSRVVNYWVHAHHLLSEGKKMAKSSRNEFLVSDVVERGFDPLAFRHLSMQTRYRSQTNFTWDALEAAQRGLDKLRIQMAEWSGSGSQEALSKEARELDLRFRSAVANDLDMPRAMSVIAEVASKIIDPAEKFRLLLEWDSVLGLDLTRDVSSTPQLPAGATQLIDARESARKAGDFSAADVLRDELAALGVSIIDTAQGPRWIVKR